MSATPGTVSGEPARADRLPSAALGSATWVSISQAEWVWVAAMTALVILLTQIPPTAARLVGPGDRVHVGSYWYAGDFSQYRATMREAATTSSWLIHDHFSAEPHEPIFMYPLYVAIGKLSATLGLPALGVYAVAELAMRVILPVGLYLFVAALVADGGTRRFAFILAAFSGGLGIWFGLAEALVATVPPAIGGRALNTYVETVTFGTFMAAPHVGIGLVLTLAAVVSFAAAARGLRWALAALSGSILALAAIHPFNLPVLLTTFSVFALVKTVVQRRPAWRALGGALTAGLVGTPLLLYNFVTFSSAPFWSQTYGAQNVMPSPRLTDLPVDYGLVLLAAPLGIYALRRRGATLEQQVLLTWLMVGVVWMYLPVPYQRRFAFGLQPALAILAALGWPLLRPAMFALVTRLGLPDRARAGAARRLAQYPLLILGFATPLAAYFAIVLSAATNQPVPLYLVDRDTYAVGKWIAERTGADDVTAGSFNTGNVLAGIVPGRVLIGYDVATMNFRAKRATIESLYRGELSDEEARQFLADNRVTYLIVGPEERKVGSHDPGAQLGLPVAVRVGEAVAYRRS